MTDEPAPGDGAPGPETVAEALSMFEQSLELLQRDGRRPPWSGEITIGTLPSLLEQCEAVATAVATRRGPAPRLLIGFRGLPQLDAEWWHRQAPGLRCYALGHGPVPVPASQDSASRAAEGAAREAGIAALAQALHRAGGYDLLLTGTLGDPLPQGIGEGHALLLVCHPWAAFTAADAEGQTLDEFSAALSRNLDQHPDLHAVKVEDLAGPSRDQAAALSQALGLPRTGAEPSPLPSFLLHAPASSEQDSPYELLCARLGYDPDLRSAPPPLGTTAGPRRPGMASMGSSSAWLPGFLAQLDRLEAHRIARNAIALLPHLTPVLDAPRTEFLFRLDALNDGLSPEDAALASLMAAAHMMQSGDRLQTLGLLAEGVEHLPEGATKLREFAAALYLSFDAPPEALSTLSRDLLRPGVLPGAARHRLMQTIEGLARSADHGHALLIAHLTQNPPLPVAGRRRLMVEIGTTRETVPGQGSTEKLATLCDELGMDFVTVDMDPRNSRNARRMFARLGLDQPRAVTAKGEDYLREAPGPFDYVFLDAYDFDHGMHSDLRQGRYERYIGSRIDETACHAMHLDCAQSLIGKLSEDGLICFDDTWTDDAGHWTAKGTTAMPFLLEQGFKLIEARNRAALLTRP